MQVAQETPVDSQSELVEMLSQAAELEHALCCQYLYAAFTLRQPGDPGVSQSQSTMLAQWGQQVYKVAIQEMYHLTLANDLLTAVNAKPNFWRPNFPEPKARYADIHLPSRLSAFTLETVSRFMCWEKPETTGWWDDVCGQVSQQEMARLATVLSRAEMDEIAQPPPYRSIGQLYGIIDASLRTHPEWIDPNQADRQVTSRFVPFTPRVRPITDYSGANTYIQIIVTEGEGAPDWLSYSHFAYFHQIVNQLKDVPAFTAAWPTVDNPVYDPAHVKKGAHLIEQPGVRDLGTLFNDIYVFLLQVLHRLWDSNGESPDERQALANASMAIMPLGIKRLGILLTRLPAGPEYPGQYAGPSFELPDPLPTLAGDHTAAWIFLYARMVELSDRCRILSVQSTGLSDSARTELDSIAADLETLVPLFDLRRGVVRRD